MIRLESVQTSCRIALDVLRVIQYRFTRKASIDRSTTRATTQIIQSTAKFGLSRFAHLQNRVSDGSMEDVVFELG